MIDLLSVCCFEKDGYQCRRSLLLADVDRYIDVSDFASPSLLALPEYFWYFDYVVSLILLSVRDLCLVPYSGAPEDFPGVSYCSSRYSPDIRLRQVVQPSSSMMGTV